MSAPNETGEELLLQNQEETVPQTEVVHSHRSKHRFLPFIHKMYWFFYRKPLFFLIFLPAATNGFILIQAYVYMGKIVDALGEENPIPLIRKYSLLTFIFAFFCAILSFCNFAFWIQIGSIIGIKIKRLLFKSYMEKDIEFYDRRSIGELLNLLNDDSMAIEGVFEQSKVNEVKAIGQLVSAVIVSARINLELTMLSLSVSVIIAVILKFFRQQGGKHMRARSIVQSVGVTVFDEIISNPRVVYSNNQEENEAERFNHVNTQAAYHHKTMHCLFFSAFETGSLINSGTLSMIITLGGYIIMHDKLSVGDLLAIIRATRMFGFELMMIMGSINREVRAWDSADRIWETVEDPIKIDPYEGIAPESIKGDIEFKNVWFKYPTRDSWILKNVSFCVQPGEISAFVGHSGSGKSTIVQLLMRFYDVNEGQVLIDGKDIREYSPSFLHRSIGVVQQDSALFTMTVKENLKYGAPNATDEEVVQAAVIANADKFIRKLPQEYNSSIGEKGMNLSGGQRQRLAIARAVVKNPKILITDEATAALDAVSEKKVQKALDNVMKGRTSIIVAHRLGTIRSANMIYVFDAGELVESGTHEELVSKRGSYYDLVKLQLED